jgi:hypothetical protein
MVERTPSLSQGYFGAEGVLVAEGAKLASHEDGLVVTPHNEDDSDGRDLLDEDQVGLQRQSRLVLGLEVVRCLPPRAQARESDQVPHPTKGDEAEWPKDVRGDVREIGSLARLRSGSLGVPRTGALAFVTLQGMQ